jgi:hypothetical protein
MATWVLNVNGQNLIQGRDREVTEESTCVFPRKSNGCPSVHLSKSLTQILLPMMIVWTLKTPLGQQMWYGDTLGGAPPNTPAQSGSKPPTSKIGSGHFQGHPK